LVAALDLVRLLDIRICSIRALSNVLDEICNLVELLWPRASVILAQLSRISRRLRVHHMVLLLQISGGSHLAQDLRMSLPGTRLTPICISIELDRLVLILALILIFFLLIAERI